MRAEHGRLHDVQRTPDARREHFRFQSIIFIDGHQLSNELYAFLRDVCARRLDDGVGRRQVDGLRAGGQSTRRMMSFGPRA